MKRKLRELDQQINKINCRNILSCSVADPDPYDLGPPGPGSISTR
jgi:hypothetical protein